MEDLTDTPFKAGEKVWFTEHGEDRAAEVSSVLDDGFEYEIVLSNRATTAHLTELRVRS
jgi:hypothetical protein